MSEPVFSTWHWAGFVAAVLVLLALDLGVFHREARKVRFREALGWTGLFFALACAFAVWLYRGHGRVMALEFFTGYLIELSLSMDNVFVIALIFGYFRVPVEFQHRVLFWGIIGALVMRGVLIIVGAALIREFHWLLYVLGAVLVITGIKMLFSKEDGVHPEKNPLIRLARRIFPVSSHLEGQRFTTRLNGRLALTPLALVLVMVETTDLVFALDSIPAIFAITQNDFLVFTSNVFAILGLRSLYFALAGAIEYFRYLKVGLSLVLIFIGVKMLLAIWAVKIPIGWALGAVAGIIVAAIGASLAATLAERRRPPAAT
ncbi:MAG: TerC family protein [Limisphaerales bacterium]